MASCVEEGNEKFWASPNQKQQQDQYDFGDSRSSVDSIGAALKNRLLVLVGLAGLQLLRNTPGGKWLDDKTSHRAGDSILASTHPNINIFLVLTNSIALGSALLAIFLITVVWTTRSILARWTASSATWVSLIAIAMSYVGSTMAIAPHTKSSIVTIVVMLGSIIITLLIAAFYPLILFHLGRGTDIQLDEDLTIHHLPYQICQLFEALVLYSDSLLKSLRGFVLAQAKPFRLLLV